MHPKVRTFNTVCNCTNLIVNFLLLLLCPALGIIKNNKKWTLLLETLPSMCLNYCTYDKNNNNNHLSSHTH